MWRESQNCCERKLIICSVYLFTRIYLQSRLVEMLTICALWRVAPVIQDTFNANDVSRFHQVRQSIIHASAQRSSPASKSTASRSGNSASSSGQFATATMPPLSAPNAFSHRNYHTGSATTNGYATNSPYGSAASALNFRSSPFYKIEALIGTLRVCDGKCAHSPCVYLATVSIVANSSSL